MEMDDPFGDDPNGFNSDAVASVSTSSVQVLEMQSAVSCMIQYI